MTRRAAAASLALAALLAAGGSAGCGRGPSRGAWRGHFEAPKHVVLVTLDTFRADRIRGDRFQDLTPNLRRMAGQGVWFTRAYATNPVTLPSHCSLLTGLFPQHHGVRDNGVTRLPENIESLAERYRAAGFETSAFVSAAPLSRLFGIDQGFQHYDEDLPARAGADHLYAERSGEETLARFEAHFRARAADAPTFDWIHLFDAHFPYAAPAAFQADGRSPYDAEVAHVDALVGRLAEFLSGSSGKVLVVIAADHGEGLGEHGEDTHSVGLYEATTRVPLILWAPGGDVGGTVEDAVSLVDVAPTLASLSGLPASGAMDGVDLFAGEPSRVYLESLTPFLKYGVSPQRGCVDATWKFLSGPLPELFELGADPAEDRNLFFSDPEHAARLQEVLAGFPDTAAAGPSVEMSREQLEQLASLGYVSSGLRTLPSGPGMDVKEFLPLYRKISAARAANDHGRPAEAAGILQEVAAALPDVPGIQEEWGRALVGSGRAMEARARFARALELDDRSVSAWIGAGNAEAASGEYGEAAARFQRALDLEPGIPEALLNLGLARDNLGDRAGAAAAFREFLAVEPTAPERKQIEQRLKEWGMEP